MALVLHLVFAQDAVRVVLDHDLIAFVEGVRRLIEITTSDQEESPGRSLNALEIVWEIH